MTITLSTSHPGKVAEFVDSCVCDESRQSIAEAVLNLSEGHRDTMQSWFQLAIKTADASAAFIFDKAYQGMHAEVARQVICELARKRKTAA